MPELVPTRRPEEPEAEEESDADPGYLESLPDVELGRAVGRVSHYPVRASPLGRPWFQEVKSPAEAYLGLEYGAREASSRWVYVRSLYVAGR